MQGSLPPIWIDPELEQGFERTIVRANFQRPADLDVHLVPVPWLVAVTGRPGTDKRRIIETLCTKHNISYDVVTAELGQTRACMAHIDSARAAANGTEQKPVHLLILDKADILARFPHDEDIMMQSLDLRLLRDSGIVLVALFDELYSRGFGYAPTARQECMNQFISQFTHQLYAKSETPSEFRQSYFQWYVDKAPVKREGMDSMTMADETGPFPTVDDMRVLVQRAFQHDPPQFHVADKMQEEWRRLESRYSEGMERGPIVKKQKT